MSVSLLLAALLAAQAPAVPSFTPETCDDPVARKALLAAGPDGSPLFAALTEHSETNKARMTKLLDRLTARAKLSAEQRANVVRKMLQDPAFKAALADSMAQLEKITTSAAGFTSEDTPGNCRIVIGLAAEVPAIKAGSERQWRAMQAVMEAEAKRLGVSLAD